MTAVTFYGHVAMTYPHYIDTATGRALSCVPGGTYNIIPASGSPLSGSAPTPSDGRFSSPSLQETAPKKAKGRTPAQD